MLLSNGNAATKVRQLRCDIITDNLQLLFLSCQSVKSFFSMKGGVQIPRYAYPSCLSLLHSEESRPQLLLTLTLRLLHMDFMQMALSLDLSGTPS